MGKTVRGIIGISGILVLLVVCVGIASAELAPDIAWQKVLGGSVFDEGYSIQQTSDGGYILTGYTESSGSGDVGPNHGGYDAWVVKLDSAGTIVWQKVLGGSGYDLGSGIQQTSDGGYILAGYTDSDNNGDVGPNHGGNDAWIVKLDSAGTIVWQKVLGGNGYDQGYSIRQTGDGGYILAGSTDSDSDGDVGPNHCPEESCLTDVWVVKLDSAGTIVWQKVLGGSGVETASSVWQTGDGGYILTGYTFTEESESSDSGDVGPSHGSEDVWVVKLNSAGTIVWQKVLGGDGSEFGASIRQTSDGGYILTGSTDSDSNGDVGPNHCEEYYCFTDAWVVKLDSTGAITWQKVFGGNDVESGQSILQTGDGGYILAGYAYSNNNGDVGPNNGVEDFWVLKLDSTGTITWQKVMGGSKVDEGLSIWQTGDDGYILTGFTNSDSSGDVGPNHGSKDVWVVKLAGTGSPVIILPGCTNPPTDPDGDGIYEDLNGNGRMDFADVVLYFTQMDWIAENEPIAAFDLNGNGRIDFADIVALFNEI